MNEMQATFYNYIMSIVMDDKKEEMEKIVQTSFQKQAEGTFTLDYIKEIAPTMMTIIKPECLASFLENAKKMGDSLQK